MSTIYTFDTYARGDTIIKSEEVAPDITNLIT